MTATVTGEYNPQGWLCRSGARLLTRGLRVAVVTEERLVEVFSAGLMQFRYEDGASQEKNKKLRHQVENIKKGLERTELKDQVREEKRAKWEKENEHLQEELRKKHEEWKDSQKELERLRAQQQAIREKLNAKVFPTRQERRRAEERLVQGDDRFHIAVAGTSGSGKSSLINALRGLRNQDSNAARIGITETTKTITPYPDPSSTEPYNKFVWYDVPGAGTLKIPGPQYFNAQGLFIFDLIIVLIDNRFTEQDIAILQQCEAFKIPAFIVRSKTNQHINNIMRDQLGYTTDDSDDEEDYYSRLTKAKEILVEGTKATVRENLREGELNPNQRVYMVCSDGVRSAVRAQRENKEIQKLEKIIDERELIRDLAEAIVHRRYDLS
ncbi:interferon-inducible GTPase-domain-containing protein [Kalaharituber pfeilii]|nr:interferon-inducible GTPase-domain-containing protein [Kalaharituber pfeilii]